MAPRSRSFALLGALTLLAACGSSSTDRAPSAAPTTTTTTVAPELPTTTAAPPETTSPPPPPTSPPQDAVSDAEADAAAVAQEFAASIENEEVRAACEQSTLLRTVDHPGAIYRIGVIGDSLTVQVLDELTADERFNWSVSAVCGARAEHYLGAAALGEEVDLRPGLDAVLATEPDALVIALGSNAVLRETFTNVPYDLAPGIRGILESTAGVGCRTWLNVHTAQLGDDTAGPGARWVHYSTHYDEVLAAFTEAAGVLVTDWDAVVAAGPPARLLVADGVHLTAEGRTERSFVIQNVLTGIVNTCVVDQVVAEALAAGG